MTTLLFLCTIQGVSGITVPAPFPPGVAIVLEVTLVGHATITVDGVCRYFLRVSEFSKEEPQHAWSD